MSRTPLWRLAKLIWGDWQTNQLWQRIFKSSLSVTIALIIAVIPQVVAIYGTNTYLAPMTAVFAHSGQRMAKMYESLLLIIIGTFVGLGWSHLGLYLSSLAAETDASGASSIRAVFMLIAVLVHGFIRSSTPRLFVSVWLFLVASASTLMGKATEVSLSTFTNIIYPVLTGAAVVLTVNLCIFPELSTSYLGSSTLETLSDTMDTLDRATYWFVTPGGDSDEAKKKAAESSDKDKKKEKTWWSEFKADFPNPFKTTGNKRSSTVTPLNLTTLANLTDKKTKLRAALMRCKAAQDEVNFEYSISPLPPKSLKPISKHCMSSLVQNAVTLIGACENKYVLLGAAVEDESDFEEDPELPMLSRDVSREIPAPASSSFLQQIPELGSEDSDEDYQRRIDEVKPLRELESGSVEILESILRRLRDPVEEFEAACKEAALSAMTCIAYCFDVPKLPSGARRPHGIRLEEIDLRIDIFTNALARFDQQSTEELKTVVLGETGQDFDLMPRIEMFLVSSFLLGFRQAALHILQVMRHSRDLVEQRKNRNDRPVVWLPNSTDIRQWLTTSGENDAMVLPESARKEVRTGKTSKPAPSSDSADTSTSEDPLPWQKKKDDEEKALGTTKPEDSTPGRKRSSTSKTITKSRSLLSRVRTRAADILEWAQHSDDLAYALKLTIAVFIVSWPSFVASWRAWYGDVRGIWAPLQLVLVFEVAIGNSLFIFFIRLFGVIFGCVMGYASYEIARGNRVGMIAILILGIVPAVYIQIATRYVKAGMISITTMCVVALGMYIPDPCEQQHG